MSEDILLEPVKAYTSTYKQAVNDEAGVYFDALVEKSGIDVEANRQTIKDIKKKEAELKDVKKQISKLKAGKTALILGDKATAQGKPSKAKLWRTMLTNKAPGE